VISGVRERSTRCRARLGCWAGRFAIVPGIVKVATSSEKVYRQNPMATTVLGEDENRGERVMLLLIVMDFYIGHALIRYLESERGIREVGDQPCPGNNEPIAKMTGTLGDKLATNVGDLLSMDTSF
jgi:hypothetical protein